MNRFAALTILALLPASAFAQGPVTKVIRLRYANPKTVVELIQPGSGVNIVGDNGLRAVVVKGPPSELAAAEQAVKELDTPPPGDSAKDIELTVYVIGATSKSASQTAAPREIEPVMKQLEGIFPYASYQVLDTMLIRSREGRSGSTSGMMKSLTAGQNSTASHYYIAYDTDADPAESNPRTVRFHRFQFKTKDAGGPDVGFDTDLDVREAQKVVVGKTDVDGGDAALFVVLTAKLLD